MLTFVDIEIGNALFQGIFSVSQLFKFNRSRRLTGQVKEYAVDALDLIDDTVHDLLQD